MHYTCNKGVAPLRVLLSPLPNGTLSLSPSCKEDLPNGGTPYVPSVNSEKENAMKTRTFILASMALFALGVGSATSGPCTIEIDGLAKTLAAKDAGSGPTAGASGGTQSAARPSDQHPPTAAMSQETQGKATSPEDVRRQTAGQPTAAQQGTTGAAAGPDASSALNRARALDQQGKEAECMQAVGEAKQLAGPR